MAAATINQSGYHQRNWNQHTKHQTYKSKSYDTLFFAKLAISEEQAHQIANTMTQPPGEIIYSQNPTWWPINTWPRGESPICTTTYHTNDYFVHLLILKSTTQFFLYINWGA